MDQSVELNPGNRRLAVERLCDFVVKSIDAALHGARVGWGKLERRASAGFEGAG